MRLLRPDWFRPLVLALVFGLTCGANAPVLWAAAPVLSSAPEEEDETLAHSAKTAASERRTVRPARDQAGRLPRPRVQLTSPSATHMSFPALPAAALRNGLSAHYRC